MPAGPHPSPRQPRDPVGRARHRVDSFLTRDIWRQDADRLGWPLAPLYRVLRVGQLAVRGIVLNRATFTASALTYSTVLSLVPLLAFAFSVAKGVGGYERLRSEVIEPFIVSNLGERSVEAPASIQSLHEAIDRILELVSATDVSSLGAFGLSILVFAVLRVLSGVEDAFNRIWGVRRARSWVRRAADYISLAVATPLLLLLAVAFTSGAQNSALVESLRARPLLARGLDTLFDLTPLVSVWLGFTLLFLILPNTRVRPISAALGGIVGGTLWQLAQLGHVKFQIGIANYNAIYSGFAAFPIFLVWIYVSWVTVMYGAEFAHAHQNAGYHRQLKNLDLSIPRNRDLLVLRSCARIVRRFLDGEGPMPKAVLAAELSAPAAPLGEVLDPLVAAGLLAESDCDEGPAWVIARDPVTTRVSEVLGALHGLAPNEGNDPNEEFDPNEEPDRIEETYSELLSALARTDANLRLEELARIV